MPQPARTNDDGTCYALPRRTHDWTAFDGCARDTKELVWYGLASKVTVSRSIAAEDLPRRRAELKELERQDTLRVYGPDHPQAASPDPLFEALELSDGLPQGRDKPRRRR